uniref:Uncharacterized protein n=1 Tax=Moniliophthora roreri TaxID=221103 RepID=A0A0W0FZL6_MONRR
MELHHTTSGTFVSKLYGARGCRA